MKAAVTRVNDAARDRTREIFAESLAVCVTEDESIAPESLATIAGQIESAMSASGPTAEGFQSQGSTTQF